MVEFLKSRLDNKHLLDAVKSKYSKDYQLIHSVKFQ
jgi:hypothetical protein